MLSSGGTKGNITNDSNKHRTVISSVVTTPAKILNCFDYSRNSSLNIVKFALLTEKNSKLRMGCKAV